MKTVGIVYNASREKARRETAGIRDWLKRKNCRPVVLPSTEPPREKLPSIDLALSLGGDGTMLRAGRLFAPLGVPLLGINLGSLGFLAETDPDEAYTFLEAVLSGNFRTEERSLLAATVVTGRKTVREIAMNECTVTSGSNGRLVSLTADINGGLLAEYVGDGLIIATPTGSTAYSLASSGPIVHPGLPAFVITPICPHTLTQRPLIVSTNDTVSIRVSPQCRLNRALVTLDGQTNYYMTRKGSVTLSAYEKPLYLITNPRRTYFQVLRTKLKWGER